jgi:diguanylate cyclase (GGDEF)-like protein
MKELEAFYQVARTAVGNQNLEQVLDAILSIIKGHLGYPNAALLLKEPEGQNLYIQAAVGYPRDKMGMKLKVGQEGICGHVAAEGKTLYVPDVSRDKRYVQGISATRSELAVPLLYRDHVIGVLDVESPRLNAFSPGDIQLLENFAGQAALVINKVRLEELAEKRIRELSDINGIAQTLSAGGDSQAVTGSIARQIAQALSADKCLLTLFHPDSGDLTGLPPAYLSQGLTARQRRTFAGPEELAEAFRLKLSQGGIAAKVYHDGRPYYSNDLSQDPHAVKSLAELFEIGNVLVAPLYTRNRVIGLVYVADKTGPQGFTAEDAEAATGLASQAALVLDNVRLYNEMAAGLKQLSIIYQFSQAIGALDDSGDILQAGIETLSQVIPADSFSLMLLDPADKVLRVKASRGLSSETVAKLSFPLGQGLAGWVAQKRQPVISDDLASDKRFKLAGQEEKLASAVSVPLMAQDRVMGVLNINNFVGNHRRFQRQDLELATTLGNSIAMALERAELVADLDGRISAQGALLDISSLLLGTLEVSQVLDQIARQIENLIPFQRLAIYKVDWEQRKLSPILARGPNTDAIMADPPFSMDEGLTGAIARNGKAELIPDTDRDKRTAVVPGTTADPEALMVLPLMVEGQSQAVLVVGREVSPGFSSRDFNLASLFANQAAVAWRNANLFTELKGSQEKLGETNSRLNLALKRQVEVSTSLSTMQYLSSALLSSLQLEEILSVIVEGIRSNLGFDAVLISLVEGDGKTLSHKANFGFAPEEMKSINGIRSELDQYQALMKPEYRVSNSYFIPLGDESGNGGEAGQQGQRRWQPGNLMIVPLSSKDKKLLAIIQVDKPTDGLVPDNRKVRSLEAFANTAAVAITNAYLYQDAQSRIAELSTLYDIGMVISSAIERDKLLERVVEVIREKLHYLKVAIFMVEPQSKSIFIGSQCGYGDELNMLYFTVGGKSVVGWVAEQGQPLIVNDVSQEPRYNAIDPRVRSEIAVPIRQEDRVIGVLNIEDDRSNAFGPSDLNLLTTLASQVAVALDNARLYEEARRRIKELSALHNVGATVSSTLRLDALLDQVCHILNDTFRYNKIAIMIADRESGELVFKASLGYQNILGEMGRRLKIGSEGITGMVAATGETILVGDVTQNPNYVSIDGKTRSELAVPLKIKQRVVGVLNVESDNVDAFDQVDKQLLTTLATQVAVAIENARLYEETELLAVTDGLTGLNNHRFFQAFFERELSRARRYNHPLSLIMIDIDHFKKINDSLGHPVGDQVLQEVARLLKEQARDVDLAARYGGEEFMLVLPETKRGEAQSLAERIRQRVEGHDFKVTAVRKPLKVTISLGVSGFPEDGTEKSQIIDKVDKALYRAKSGGRNQVRS